jgi:cytidyltransferase-like protein
MIEKTKNFAIISGYFAPLHKGHLDNIKYAYKFGSVIVIVNNDKQLVHKRGKSFMDQKNRQAVMQSIKNVDKCYIAKDKDGTVCATLKQIRKDYPKANLFFVKGGDRTASNTPEAKVCKALNIIMKYDSKSKKVYSSRDFLKE